MAEICFWRGRLSKSSLKIEDNSLKKSVKNKQKSGKKMPFLSKKNANVKTNSGFDRIVDDLDRSADFVDEKSKSKRGSKLKNKRIEYRNSEEYQKILLEKETAKKQKEKVRAQKRKIKEEKEEIFVGKMIAKRKKYADRMSKTKAKFGKTQIEIEGENAHRVLLAISKIAKVEKVESSKECVRFVADSKQCHKIIALLKNLCYDYKIIKISGVSPALFGLVSRVGIMAGICVCIVAFVILSSFVTRVSVLCEGAGNAAIKTQIDGILNEYGVKKGARLKTFDLQGVESAITSLEGVAFASVSRKGTHVSVLYKTALKKESFVEANSKSIFAKKRAVVTRVIVEGGTAVKKYGDVVDIGDELIAGYIEYGDSKIPVEARGYAYGKVYYKRTVYFANVEQVETVIESKKYTRLGIFSTPKPPKSPYEDARLKTEVAEFGYLLPLKIYTFEFEKLGVVERANELDELGMKKAVYSYAIADLQESATVLDAYYEVTKTEDGTYVTLTLETEEII